MSDNISPYSDGLAPRETAMRAALESFVVGRLG